MEGRKARQAFKIADVLTSTTSVDVLDWLPCILLLAPDTYIPNNRISSVQRLQDFQDFKNLDLRRLDDKKTWPTQKNGSIDGELQTIRVRRVHEKVESREKKPLRRA